MVWEAPPQNKVKLSSLSRNCVTLLFEIVPQNERSKWQKLRIFAAKQVSGPLISTCGENVCATSKGRKMSFPPDSPTMADQFNNFFLFLLLFNFLNYILLIMLLHLSQFCPICSPSPSAPNSQLPHAIPTTLVMSMGHAYKFFGYFISYTVLYIPMAIL